MIVFLLIVFLALSTWFNVSQPIWEAPEEAAHVEYVRFVQVHRALPRGRPTTEVAETPVSASGSEFSQVPLYYLALALALGPLAPSPEIEWHRNPHITWPGHPHRHAVALHRSDEGWPYRDVSRFVHAGRLVSALLGLVTLLSTYALVAAITGRQPLALFATAWVGWSPLFLLVSSRVNNDAGATAWGALTLFLCARLLVVPGGTRWPVLLAVSLTLGGAVLSKLHLVYLVPLVGYAAVAAGSSHGNVWLGFARRFARGVGTLALPLTLLAVWWLAHGRSFDSWVDEQAGIGVARVWEVGLSAEWARLPAALWALHVTGWGTAGANADIRWPPAVYVALLAPVLLLLANGLRVLGDARQWDGAPPRARAAAVVLTLSTLPLLYATLARQVVPSVNLDANARFVLPAAPVAALVVALGGRRLLPARLHGTAASAYLAAILAVSAATPLALFPQINAPTVPVWLARGDELSTPPVAAFANGVELLPLADLPARARPGEPLRLVLRWRVTAPPAEDFTVAVQLADRNGERLASDDAVPLRDALPPRRWLAGEIVEEERSLALPAAMPPGHYALRLALYILPLRNGSEIRPIAVASAGTTLSRSQKVFDGFGDTPNPARTGSALPGPSRDAGELSETYLVTVGTVRVLPDVSDDGLAPLPDVRFGDSLILRAAAPQVPGEGGGKGEERGATGRRAPGQEEAFRQVVLLWEAQHPLARDLVVSVQLLDTRGGLVAQHDAEPAGGRLPTTTWLPGDRVRDEHRVSLPAGERDLRTVVVVYDRATGQRLPVAVGGQPVGDYLIIDGPLR
ncbi:MAG: phospholipid carrier-dependent glycosyltransferase [Chloroflexi bacterium]|nr:phospholipid carrier-dependent glycosyltransferase [Chloroflexota bacterium]